MKPVRDARCPHGSWSTFRQEIAADIDRYLNKTPFSQGGSGKQRLSAFLTPDCLGVALYRVSHLAWARGWTRSARLLSRLNFLIHKADLAPQSCIGGGFRLPHPAGVNFCGRAGGGLTLYSLATVSGPGGSPDAPLDLCPDLGDAVTVGGHAAVTGPVRVGSRATIAYTVVLDHDAPEQVLVVSRNLRGRIRPRNGS